MSGTEESPMAKAMREFFDDIKCWAVHIEGPDDILPAPSKRLAQFAADVTNRWLCEAAGEDLPAWRAVVVEWTHGYETWKAGSEQFVAEWADWITHQDADSADAPAVPLTDELIEACSRAAHTACDSNRMARWSTEFARAVINEFCRINGIGGER